MVISWFLTLMRCLEVYKHGEEKVITDTHNFIRTQTPKRSIYS